MRRLRANGSCYATLSGMSKEQPPRLSLSIKLGAITWTAKQMNDSINGNDFLELPSALAALLIRAPWHFIVAISTLNARR
jgi:hypothetical protein